VKKRKALALMGSICLVLILAALPFMTACAQPAPSPTPAPAPAPTPAPTPAPAPAPSPEKVWELRLASVNPVTMSFHSAGTQPWCDMVEEATKGRVKITVFPSQTLCKVEDSWTAVNTGVADITFHVTGYYPGMFPLSDIVALPFLGPAPALENSQIFWRVSEEFPEIQAE